MKSQDIVRLIAFYLPQFHPIPENDEWWGKGFTEWTNVTKARPQFPGHYQPHLPAELGFYDLRLPEVRKAQADLARQYGIYGFCYYHYWFNGKLLLEKPIHEVLGSGEPDFPFCLCWANESWTRAWDGRSGTVLMEQSYNDQDDRQHMRYLARFFSDRRYIKVNEKPLFLIYRASHIPDPRMLTDTMRDEAQKLGLGEIYLCRVESFPGDNCDPYPLGFDASVEFQPDWNNLGAPLDSILFSGHSVYRYGDIAQNMIRKEIPAYKRFPCVSPSWDNSARRPTGSLIMIDSTPELYELWLQAILLRTITKGPKEGLVFINAWNEWAEGNYLEPDQKFGRAYLKATYDALNTVDIESAEFGINRILDVIKSKTEAAFNKPSDSESGEDVPELVTRLRDQVLLCENKIGERDLKIKQSAALLTQRERRISEVERQLDSKDNHIRELLNSWSWKVTAPMRFIWKFNEYKMKSRPLHLLNEGLKVIRDEGLLSFAVKVKQRLMPHKKPLPKFKQESRIRPVSLPDFTFPKVSVVIPVFNKSLYTFNCLLSISENTDHVPYEVIVVDNASTDNTAEMLSMVKNIRVVRNDENLGFVDACNIGASEAKGENILFLNNDTMVTPGWLSALQKTLDHYPDCGAVGSKLIYPDGRLQEAGGIIWQDARGWNYGRFQDPEKPEFNYVREVDYCSGAALMVRRELFERLEGFDQRFAPAYWEDTDLCFSVRKLGYKVLYQPASVVIHFEGISAGTSTASGMKRHQDLNTPKFVEKWAEELARQVEHKPEMVFLARDRNKGKRVLVIDHYVPTYDKDAGSFFMYSFLRALVDLGYRIVFWPENLFRTEPYTSELQQMGIEVIYGKNSFKDYMKSYGKFFDCAVITRTHIAIHFVDRIREYIPKVIYHAPDFEYVRLKRQFELEGGSADELEQIRSREFYLFNQSDVVTTVSPEEAELIREAIPGKEVVHIHHPIDKITDMTTPFEDRKDLLFVGSSHSPNADAMLYYANEIMPILHKQLPGVKMYVVGGNPDKRLRELNSEHVVLTGFVKNLLPYFEKCRLYCAPLRYGAGVKGKIIEAMSYGLPVVTTSVGAEGLGVDNERHMLIADDNEKIVESILKLYNDKAQWELVSRNSKDFVAAHFSQNAFREKVKRLLEALFIARVPA